MTRSYSKKYRQLKLQVDPLYDQYHGVLLSFRVRQHKIEGVLNGNTKGNNAVRANKTMGRRAAKKLLNTDGRSASASFAG